MTALLSSCPYPPDDYAEKHARTSRTGKGSISARPDYFVQPKIRPSAQKIHEMHKGSIGLMFGLDKHQIATGFKSGSNKNHMALNVQKMREMQRKSREATTHRELEEAEANKPMRPLTATNPKFSNVQSKVKLKLESDTEAARNQNNATFLKAHTRPASAPAMKKSCSESELKLNLSNKPTQNGTNFVQLNTQHISAMGKTAPKSHQQMMEKREKDAEKEQAIQQRKGKVPKYLTDMKQQRQKDYELEIANQPDPQMPPGHRKMSEAERVKTLTDLETSRKELLAELQRLPIAIRSQRVAQRKQEIESKLASLEEAILIFARPKVFVKIDQ